MPYIILKEKHVKIHKFFSKYARKQKRIINNLLNGKFNPKRYNVKTSYYAFDFIFHQFFFSHGI